MSILQKILDDMYIEPELLAELDDDKKQVLFCKLREEQVRRYLEFERTSESTRPEKGRKTKNLRWLTGADGQPWVWVMGEHPNDKTIDQILDEEAQEKATKLAEQETEMLRLREEGELKEKLRQEQLEIERDRLFQRALDDRQKETTLGDRTVELNGKLPTVLEDSQMRLFSEGVVMRRKDPPSRDNGQETFTELEKRLRAETDRRMNQEKNRRTSEIYQTLVEAREKIQAEAADAAEEERRYWETQEQKFREAEDQIRILAKKAREQHKSNTLMTSSSLLQELNNNTVHPASSEFLSHNGWHDENSVKSSKSDHLEKVESRSSVVFWFLQNEAPRGAGLLPGTSRMASWFHGILDRRQAEILLASRLPGSFLIRLNGRIRASYALSYKNHSENPEKFSNFGEKSSNFRHFLIHSTQHGYKFFGDDSQIIHRTLWDLVNYHQTVPITFKGNEILKESVGQLGFPPDYQELLTLNSTDHLAN